MYTPAWEQSDGLVSRLSSYGSGDFRYSKIEGGCCCPQLFDQKDREIDILMETNRMLHSSPCCGSSYSTAMACCGVKTCCCGS